jgi:hypothetical protein
VPRADVLPHSLESRSYRRLDPRWLGVSYAPDPEDRGEKERPCRSCIHQVRPLVPGEAGLGSALSLELPQFPIGTQVALAREMLLINDEGSLL